MTRKQIAIGFGSLLIILLTLVIATSPSAKDSFEAGREAGKQIQMEQQKIKYEIAFHEDVGNVENYWLLVSGEETNKESLEKLARDFKKEKCKKDCNISLFNDKRALELDMEYQKLTTIEAQNVWKEKNYIFVADHLLGYLMFGKDEFFNYYPYKDSLYNELKGR